MVMDAVLLITRCAAVYKQDTMCKLCVRSGLVQHDPNRHPPPTCADVREGLNPHLLSPPHVPLLVLPPR